MTQIQVPDCIRPLHPCDSAVTVTVTIATTTQLPTQTGPVPITAGRHSPILVWKPATPLLAKSARILLASPQNCPLFSLVAATPGTHPCFSISALRSLDPPCIWFCFLESTPSHPRWLSIQMTIKDLCSRDAPEFGPDTSHQLGPKRSIGQILRSRWLGCLQ